LRAWSGSGATLLIGKIAIGSSWQSAVKPAPALCSIKLASQSSRAKETEKGLNLAALASFCVGKVDKLRR